MVRFFIIGIMLFGIANAISASELSKDDVQQGYTTSILKKPLYDIVQVHMEAMMLNNWLNTNYEKLSNEQKKGPRERLYYIIDSYIKYLYAEEGVVYPKESDLTLITLFSWAERLGVYGGNIIYNSLKPLDRPDRPSLMKLPDTYSLKIKEDLLVISSISGGWSVKFPYYFMIGHAGDFKANNGLQTQLLSISTGAAKDKTESGHSQATIMMIYSPTSDFSTFTESWKKALGLDDKALRKNLNINDLKSTYAYDKATKLNKEMTAWSEKQGSFAVFYLGMDGTYQWNRPHYLDFLRALEIEPKP